MQALELLVSKGAAPNAKDADGQTPMHYAALSEHEQVSLGNTVQCIAMQQGCTCLSTGPEAQTSAHLRTHQ